MSVQSSSQTTKVQSADSLFPTSFAESLLNSENQMHENMERARSAFERMGKKATEAQVAKDKEIAELRKALALTESKAKAAEGTASLQWEASTQKEKALEASVGLLQKENSSLKDREKTIRTTFDEMRKEAG